MNVGKMRHRVSILKRIIGVDSDGYLTNTPDPWAVIRVVWAAVEPLSGREYFQAAAVQAEHQVKFIMYYQRGLTCDMRLQWDGRIYEIKAIPENGKRDLSEVWAEAISNG